MTELILDQSIDTILEKILGYRDENRLQVFSVLELEYYEGKTSSPDSQIPHYKKVKSVENMTRTFGEYIIMYKYHTEGNADQDPKYPSYFNRGTSILQLTADYETETTLLYVDRRFSRHCKIGYTILKNLIDFELE